MASRVEELVELAVRVIHTIETGEGRAPTRRELFQTTTHFETIGDECLIRGDLDISANAFQLAVTACAAHYRLQGGRSLQTKVSVLIEKTGECYFKMGIFDTAIYHLNEAQRIDPENFDAKFKLALAFCMVGEVEATASIIHRVLSLPSTPATESVRRQFEAFRSGLLLAHELAEMPIRFDNGDGHSPVLVNGASGNGYEDSCSNASTSDIPIPAVTHTMEPDKACNVASIPKERTGTPSQRKKTRTRSRSRSRSRVRQPKTSTSNPPPKPSKKELEKQDRRRQREIEQDRDALMVRRRTDEVKEEERRKRRDSDEGRNNSSQFPTDTDFRHVVPGWGGKQTTKMENGETRERNQSVKLNKNGATQRKELPQPVVNAEKQKEKIKEPLVPEAFDKKFNLCFACPDCYIVTGYGRQGFHFQPNINHTCARTILMVKWKSMGFTPWVKVRSRPRLAEMKSNLQFSGRFRLCEQYQEGRPCALGEARCTFCHSEEERDVWTMDVNVEGFTLTTFIQVQQKWVLEIDKRKRLDKSCTDSGAQGSHGNGPVVPLPAISCPFRLEVVCGTCWQMFGLNAKQKGNNCNTTGYQHRWESHRAFLLKPENELIRAFDPNRTRRCANYDTQGHCRYGNSCHFVHGDNEYTLFLWMARNKINHLQDVVALAKAKTTATNKRARDILTGDLQPSESPLVNGHVSSGAQTLNPSTQHFCKVCNESFDNQLSFDQHCISRKHEKNLLTDKERPWRYRPPPWGGDYPRLCNGVSNGHCRFSGKPDMYNKCMFAHSIMELDEWKERTDHFKFKKAIMREPGVFSYVHSLQDEFAKVKLESDMMMREVDGVSMDVDPEPVLFTNKKNASHLWTFTISSQVLINHDEDVIGNFSSFRPTLMRNESHLTLVIIQVELKTVALLLDESRLHFSLFRGHKSHNSVQVEDGINFLTNAESDKHYTIQVNFNTGLFGSFKQKVIFDFGTRPLLAVALDVEVGIDFVLDEIIKLRKELPMERWTSKTHTVVPFSTTANSDFEAEALLCMYKPPDTSVFSQDSLDGDLNHNNYVHRMHRLVEMEELERTRIASKFNVAAEIQLSDRLPGKEELHAPVCHLFGLVPLTDCQLSEDSDAGYLMLHGAVTAWVGLSERQNTETRPTVYEAQVVCEANFGFDGRGKDNFYICLSKRCCKVLSLKSGQSPFLSVQLQIDRLPMCRMHYGLDQLPDTSVVFPDMSRYVHLPSTSTKHRLPGLNPTQQDVVNYMAVSRTKYTPPLVVYGPFGSGKTETLARAAEEMVRIMPNARILICALNDSAADLYITHYLGNSKTIKQNQILRVYSPARWSSTVSDDLQPYCQKAKKRSPVSKSAPLIRHETQAGVGAPTLVRPVESAHPTTIYDEYGNPLFRGHFKSHGPSGKLVKPSDLDGRAHPADSQQKPELPIVKGKKVLSRTKGTVGTSKKHLSFRKSNTYADSPEELPDLPKVASYAATPERPSKKRKLATPRKSPKVAKTVKRPLGYYDWRKAKGVPSWLPTSEDDSDTQANPERKTRKAAFSDTEVAAMYAAAEPWKCKLPDLDTVNEHKIIITTLATSLMLTDSNMIGSFSHIIIDEAGQCLECEAILPLTLATDTTCVVLAGDHLQLGPKSFSAEVTPNRLKLHISVLERLVLYYLNYDKEHPGRLVKMLNVNYRSHPRIMAFISEHFYQNAIQCQSEWGTCTDFEPLVFYATHGKESTDADSTSYYNTSEVDELVERITHLYNNWPKSWGEKLPHKIAVLTPYSQQVKKVIAALVKSCPCFKHIRVSTVSDIQGEEFHAVFLSAVRTHHGTALGCDDTFGFFSDMRLVNTAITRAKCHVAVVGDPASLTSFGYCMNIWRSYLDWCNKDGCLYPMSLTLGEVRLQAESMRDKLETSSAIHLLTQRIFDIAEIEPDEIIQNLKGKIVSTDSNNCMEIIERDQRAIYRFSASQSKSTDEIVYTRKKTKWKPVQLDYTARHHRNSTDEEMYSDDEDEDEINEEVEIYQDCNEDEMLILLKKDWKKYKRCIITIEGSRRMFARNMSRNDKIHTIAISSRLRCNRSFDGDEVVIEIIPAKAEMNKLPQGKVVGILKRAMECKNFICRVDPYHHSVLIPLNRGIPHIYNLTQQNGKKKGVAVYSFSNKYRHPEFERYQTVDMGNPSDKLFIVRYLKWEANFYSPLGIAIDVIPAPTGLEDGEVVLGLEYNLRPNYQKQTKDQVAELYNENYAVPESEISKRVDFRKLSTFTIDPKGSKDFDDALSLEKTHGGFIISIHIADVSYFVPQNSPLDIEAKRRCVTYYPPNKNPVAMLPPRLSAELCSLQPEKERLSVSVRLHIDDRKYRLVKPVNVKRGIICSKSQLTYEEAQQILDQEDNCRFPKEVTESVRLLNKVAKAWRFARLSDSCHALNPKEGTDTDAHRLIEEMMIRANHEVSLILTQAYRDVVPLRLQQYPNLESLSAWFYTYHNSAQHSLSLQIAIPDQICRCNGACSCATSTPNKAPASQLRPAHGNDGNSHLPVYSLPEEQISITYMMLSHIQAALDMKDDKALKRLIATSMLHPESAIAELAYREIQETAEYRCSGDLKSDSPFHASLKIGPYSHFTSPIRRYIDIVAHRLVIAAQETRDTSYSLLEVRKICDHCNRATLKQKRYDKAVQQLKLNVVMKEHPLVVYPVVDEVQEASFHLCFPTLPKFAFSVGTIMYSDLNLHVLPTYDEEKGEVMLNWERRIYNYAKYKKYMTNDSHPGATGTSSLRSTNLNANRFVTQIPALLWHRLLHCIKENNITCLRQTSQELLLKTNTTRCNNQQLNTGKQYDESEKLELKVFPTQVHRVQLSSNLQYGRLTAQIQLVTLTDSLDICIEHHQNPITCFADTAGLKVTRDFDCVKNYILRWKPLLKAEAAFEAVANEESYILRDVSIKWTRESDQVYGAIKLNSEFCEDMQVFKVDNKNAGEEEYLCVRYNGIEVPPNVLNDDIVQTAQVETKICFVGHCLVTERGSVNGATTIRFMLHQSTMPFPEQLLAGKCLGTIQAIAMSLPMRRMLLALHGIEQNAMAKCLALGHQLIDIDGPTRRRAQKQATQPKSIVGFVEANKVQARAVSKALTQPFSVIHGPPGTGKTVTGVRIAYNFVKINKEEGSNKKVLYCGPSNKSVEVVIDYLQRTKTELRLVRVYSDDIVQLRFPDPTNMKCPRRLQSVAEQKNILRECRHQDIALHTLIRDDNHCPEFAGKIREYDQKFACEIQRMKSPNFSRTRAEKDEWKKEGREYYNLLKEASEHVLVNSDIVLVTCIGSATQKIVEDVGELINQVIIDEAGMCTEPESMVPLTSCAPKQVVLIGDHKQLQPIVQSDLAQRLGMKRSMFARYVKESDMLTIQYRMHEAIAKLPSILFYNDKLRCGFEQQSNPSTLQGLWAGGQGQPITFVDIRGEEMSQVITTADGNEQSKYNPKEANYTAKVVKGLMKSRRIRCDCIQVLSQYRAHCRQIREELRNMGVVNCDVTTVTKSQGSEVDYIVLSTVRSIPTEQIEMKPTHGWLLRCLGMVGDEHQLNVAITRARKGLVIIGNHELLSTSDVWRELFHHYQFHHAIVTPQEFLQRIRTTSR